MVKTYQLSKHGPYGASLKIAPVTTETETNANTCLQVNGTSDFKIEPQAILPNLDGFQYIGIELSSGLVKFAYRLYVESR